MKEFYTTGELAKRWGITDRTVRNWIYAGLPAVRPFPGSPWRIPASAVMPARPRSELVEVANSLAAALEHYEDLKNRPTNGAGG